MPNFNDSAWPLIDAPHDFVVDGIATSVADKSHGYLPYGVGWYRKAITIPSTAQHQSVWLDFEGVMVESMVWLNGVLLGSHGSGYTPFRFDLGTGSHAHSVVRWGEENVLVVRADATKPDSWWYDGGGIYRHVWLTVASPVHIGQWGVYAPAVIRGTISADGAYADAEVMPSVEVESNALEGTSVRVSCEVRDFSGKLVGTTDSKEVALGAGANLTLTPPPIAMKRASLWSLSRPTLYTLTATLLNLGASARQNSPSQLDRITVTFGVRSVSWNSSTGFALNGKGVKILGCANHQDFPAVGVAVPDALQEHRIVSLKAFGANAWRTAHNPPNPALLDAADRLGVLVWDENHRNGQEEEMATLVRRDRNHPSIIIWSICNEALCDTNDMAGDAAKLRDVARRLDPFMGRVVSANENSLLGPDTVLDVQGFDYATGNYDAWHARAPHVPAISSETSSAFSDRGEYGAILPGHVDAFDNNGTNNPSWGQTAEVAWQAILERPFIAGGFTWTGWDYRGEPTPLGWPDVNSHFGILDAAGFWKDRAHWYNAWWARPDPPAIHAFPHWNWSPETCHGACHQVNGSLFVDMWVYSNAEEVELFWAPGSARGNFSSLGRHWMLNYSHAQWNDVPYKPGSIWAAAYVAGEQRSLVHVETTGAPAGLRLNFQGAVGANGIRADGSDAALITAEVVDSAQRVVPTANLTVRFTADDGLEIMGTGNGDPADHTPNRSPSRAAYHGLVLAVIRARRGATPGFREVVASAPGLNLKPARIRVTILETEQGIDLPVMLV